MNKKSFLISILCLLFIASCKSPNNPNINNENGSSTSKPKVFNPNDYTSPDFDGILPNTVNEISTTSDSPSKIDSNILDIQASLYCYYDKKISYLKYQQKIMEIWILCISTYMKLYMIMKVIHIEKRFTKEHLL